MAIDRHWRALLCLLPCWVSACSPGLASTKAGLSVTEAANPTPVQSVTVPLGVGAPSVQGVAPAAPVAPAAAPVFTNPVAATLSADPSIVNANGQYYYVKSSGAGVALYHAATLAGLSKADPVSIVSLPTSGGPGDNCDLWAPELRLIDGAWWVYYSATSSASTGGVCNGTDRNASHRMFAASADTVDPAAGWTRRGKLQASDSDRWAIDGTTLQMPGGDLYFIWSGSPDGQPDGGFPQQLYIAPMSTPAAMSGPAGDDLHTDQCLGAIRHSGSTYRMDQRGPRGHRA